MLRSDRITIRALESPDGNIISPIPERARRIFRKKANQIVFKSEECISVMITSSKMVNPTRRKLRAKIQDRIHALFLGSRDFIES